MTEDFSKVLHYFDEHEVLTNEHGMNNRFRYAKAKKSGEWYFIKHADNKKEREGLHREVEWAKFMQYVTETKHDEHLKGPEIIDYISDHTLVFRYIDSPLLVERHDVASWRAHMKRYAAMLHTLDECAQSWRPDSIEGRLSRTQDFDSIWRKWLGDNINDVERYNDATVVMTESIPQITTIMQHGDLTPWQIFAEGDTWTIYDGERSGMDLPRYNDLAYGYGRLYTMLHSKDAAKSLVDNYLEVSGMNKWLFIEKFRIALINRSIGIISDAFRDKPRDDYIAEAKELLAICLDAPDKLV